MKNNLKPGTIAITIVVCFLITFGVFKLFFAPSTRDANSIYDSNHKDDNIMNEPDDNTEEDNKPEDRDDVIDDDKDNTNMDNNEEDNNVNIDKTEEYKPITMKCSKETERGLEENYFYFTWKESNYEDGYYINKYVIKLTIPERYNANDFYMAEENVNGGRYYMRLEGRTIISEIDSSHPFWNHSDFLYKNMLLGYINKQFVENGYACEESN